MMTLDKVAELLDLVADYVDETEHKKQAAVQSERETRISKIAESYTNTTGESIPDHLRDKLAGLDTEALDHLLKIANNKNEAPATLGGPSEDDATAPLTTKQAATDADARLLSWIIS